MAGGPIMNDAIGKSCRIAAFHAWFFLVTILLTFSALPGHATTTPTLTITPAATTVPVIQGASASDAFTLATGGGFTGNVTLAVSGLPTGVTAAWSSSTVTPSSGSGSSTLTFSAATTATVASTNVTVTATGDGLTVTKTYSLQVQQAPAVTMKLSHQSLSMSSMGSTTVVLTATPIGGVTVPASASGASPAIVSGLPTGITPSWSAPTVASNVVTWTLTLTGTVNAIASSGTLNLSAQVTDAKSGIAYSVSSGIPITVTLTAPTLSITPAATSIPVVQGSTASDAFTIATGGSYQGNVTLAVSGLPANVTSSWSSSTLTPASGTATSSSTLSFAAATAATVANTTITVTATGDGLTVTKTYSLQVQQAPGVTMSLSHQSLSMSSMGSTTVVLTATPIGGVTVPASASGASPAIVSGLPTGITPSWSAPTVASNVVTWTLTLTGTVNAIASSGTLNLSAQVTDAKSGIAYSVSSGIPITVTLTAPTLSITPAATSIPVVQGSTASDAFTIATGGSYQGNVTLAVSGLPANVTSSWSSSTLTPASGTATSSSTLSFAAATAATVANTTITVTATGDGLTVTKTYSLQVQQAPAVTMKLSHQSLSMSSMGSTTVVLTATPIGGVTVPASASGASPAIVSGLPTGITPSWSAPTVASNVVTWTLTLTGTVNAIASSGTLNLSAQVTDAKSGIAYSVSSGIPITVTLTAPTLSITPAATSIPVVQGSTASDAFTIATGGSYQGNVTLAVSGLPANVTSSWSSSTLTPASGTATSSSTLSFAAATAATVANTTITVTATGDGLTVTKTYSLQVQQAPGVTMSLSHQSLSMSSMGSTTVVLTATPIGGVTVPASAAGASPAIISGLPTGITPSWSAPTVASNVVTWTLTLTGTVNAIASSGTLNLSAQVTDANSGLSYSTSEGIPLTVTLTAPTLTFSPAVTKMPIMQGTSTTDLFTFTSGGSYQGNVTLAITGLPSFITASWSNSTVAMSGGTGSSTLTISPSATATINWFSFTVTATGDGLTVSKGYVVEVEPSAGIQMQLSQSSLTIQPQNTAMLVITATPVNGIAIPSGAAGASATVASGLPNGVTASMSSPTVTSAGAVTWTLTLTASATAVTSSDPINLAVQVTDANSGLVYTAAPNFDLLIALLANVSIGTTPGATIPTTFMGLSHEWNDVQNNIMGSAATGVNNIYRQLLTNLTAYGAAPVDIRIGGNSTDASVEPTSTTAAPFAQIATALGNRFELGVNLGSDNVGLATDQATAFVSQMPAGSIEALEIGNEPDEYASNGLRTSSYTVQDYFADFQNWQQSIMPILPSGTKLMGASWAFLATMQADAQTFESNEASDLSLFSQHCYASAPANNPAPDFLLTPAASASVPAQVAATVSASHAQGIPFRMGEMGAVSDGGIQAISDSFSATLWSIDTMFEYANVGVDGVNWIASTGDYNNPFQFANTTANHVKTYTLTSVNPLYYGLLFFQAATGTGAQLLPVTLNTPANLKTWATVDTSGVTRLVILNKDENLTGNVAISFPGYTQATVMLLTAPSYSSAAGITFAGQTFDGSPDGTLQGRQTVQTITGTNGVFQLPMSVTSGALVTFTQ